MVTPVERVDGQGHGGVADENVSNEIEADLVVLGSTGMTGLERALIRSVSQKVLLHSEHPVLLVLEP